MKTHKIGIIMNGVTGRMGTNQHLLRSIKAIIDQGGIKIGDTEVIMPDPILIGRSEPKIAALALTFVVAAGYDCPPSPAPIHASMKVTATAAAPCANVLAEIEARAQGQDGWVDPHNGGVYTLLSDGANDY